MSTTIDAPTGSESSGESLNSKQTSTRTKAVSNPLWDVIKPLASLRLTVGLFALSMVLVFFGTIAQIDKGVFTVVDQYFRSWGVWIPFQLIAQFAMKFFDLPESTVWKGSFPFPGGWTLGTAMLINLFAAHLTRFKLSWRRTGIIVLHLGVILLMGGELITGLFAVESRMMMQVGESKNYIDNSRQIELAFTDEATHKTITIPQGMLNAGQRINNPDLPVTVVVLERYKNTTLQRVSGGDDSNVIIPVSGGRYRVVPASEASGVKSEQSEDFPGVSLQLFKKGTDEVALPERTFSLWEYENGPASRQFMALPSRVTVDGHTYKIELRNERINKPYTITLLNFEHKKYAGTSTPKDFASTVRLQDPETSDDGEVRIWMNHPLRHQGETFYQQSTMASETASGEKKDTGTVLQVVKNPGWILPYVSCIVVALGMLIHFGIGIVKFAGKRTVVQKSAILTPTTLFQKILPWAIIAILGFYALGKMAPRNQKHNDFDVTRFGSIPVLDSGRIKPLDSVARTTMLYISGRSEWQDIDGKTQPASLWLLEVLAAGDPHAKPIADYRVFRIDNDQVLNQLELPYRPGSLRYSWNEIRNTGDKFERAFAAAQLRSEKKEAGEKVPEDDRNIFHGKILELARRLHVYEQLATYKTPTLIPKEKGSTEWQTLDSIDREAGQPFEQVAQEEVFDEVMDDLRKNGIDPKNLPRESQLRLIQKIKMLTAMRVREFGVRGRAKVSPGAAAFSNILTAYKENQPNKFSEAIDTYTSEYVLPINSEFKDRTKFEIAFNSGAPFINAAFMYLFAIVLIALSWLGWRGPLRKAAIGVALIALVLHAFGLIGRMYITDRYFVFVTNLYSTGIMIGFAAVAGCLVIERIFQNGIGLMAGASLGAITGKIAHHLATDGSDTMGSLVAVLDTNFWLASHVTTVILGYTATLISGLIGMAFIYQMLARVVVQSFQTAQAMTWDKAVAYIAAVLGIVLIPNLFVSIWITGLSTEELVSPIVSQILMYFTLGAGGVAGFVLLILRFALVSIDTGSRSSQLPAIARALQNSALDNEAMTKLGQMTYGVVCFATLLSFVGTVLGGIWADQSWGRFWGWDPKENGAVLIVIWNSLILHARWSGLVKQRGVAVLAVVGIMVTTWSWFGTNQLGVGLHNYGFNETLAEGCRWTWIICAIVIGVGLVPFKYWNSFGTGLPRPESAASSSISTSGLGTSQPQGKRSGKNR